MPPSQSAVRSTTVRVATRIGPKHQVTIPREIFSELKLEAGDYLEFEFDGQRIRIAPKKLIAKEDVWFHSPEWQAKEREADEAIRNCELSGPFTTANAILRHLKKAKGKKK